MAASRGHFRWSLVWALSGLVSLFGSLAHADDGRDRASALLKEGGRQFVARDYAGALTTFQLAYQSYPSPKIEFDIAQCFFHLDRPEDSASEYQAFLEDSVTDTSVDPGTQATARAALEDLDHQVYRVVVATAPTGAGLAVDGQEVGGGRLFVRRGTAHQLRVHAAGFDDRTLTLTEPAKGPLRLSVELAATTQPAPLPVPQAAPSDRADKSAGALATSGPAPVSHTGSWISWGAGGVLAAAGAVVGVMALGTSNGITQRGNSCPGSGYDDPQCSTWKTEAAVTDVLFGAAIAAAVTGGVLWLTAGPSASPGPANTP